MRQLNQELLERLKASQEENAKLKLLLEGNGKEESLSQGPPDIEEGAGEEQAIPETQGQGQEEEEVKED
jgi:hypothetical protein